MAATELAKRIQVGGRIEVVRATSEARLADADAAGVERVMWSAILEGHTCPLCASLHGKVFERGQVPFNPPVHINCRCLWIEVGPSIKGRGRYDPNDEELQALIAKHGHFAVDAETYAPLRIPAAPSGRDFVVRRVLDPETGAPRTVIDWKRPRYQLDLPPSPKTGLAPLHTGVPESGPGWTSIGLPGEPHPPAGPLPPFNPPPPPEPGGSFLPPLPRTPAPAAGGSLATPEGESFLPPLPRRGLRSGAGEELPRVTAMPAQAAPPSYEAPAALPAELKATLHTVEADIRDAAREHAVVFAPDGSQLGHVVGGSEDVSLPGSRESLVGAIVTHNHPNGGGFSPKDLHRAAGLDLFELRAVPTNETAVYRVQRPAGGWPGLGTEAEFAALYEQEFNRVLDAALQQADPPVFGELFAAAPHWTTEQLAARFGLRYTRELP